MLKLWKEAAWAPFSVECPLKFFSYKGVLCCSYRHVTELLYLTFLSAVLVKTINCSESHSLEILFSVRNISIKLLNSGPFSVSLDKLWGGWELKEHVSHIQLRQTDTVCCVQTCPKIQKNSSRILFHPYFNHIYMFATKQGKKKTAVSTFL